MHRFARASLLWLLLAVPAVAGARSGTARGHAGRAPRVIATLGPATSDPATLQRMLRGGMAVARINLSHADARGAARTVTALRQAEQRVRRDRRPTPLLFDLPGGKVRTGRSAAGRVELQTGQPFDLVLGQSVRTDQRQAYVSYRALGQHVKRGDRLQIGDGEVALEVVGVADRRVQTVVRKGGALRDRAGVHVQGTELPFPALTARDRRKLAIAVRHGATMVGVSLVQSPRNVTAVRRALQRLGASHVQVVAKIESVSALRQLDAIIDAADAVMIARGDLGLAVGAKKLPAVQAHIAARTRAKGKPLIHATGFMSQMLERAQPSAANVRDVRRAIAQGTSFIMLNETAIGRYPVQTVRETARLLK